MEIEEQVLTIEQAMHLQLLGLDMSDAALCYLIFTDSNGQRYSKPWFCKELCDTDEFVPTYTLQEILDKLPYDMTWDTWQWQIDHCGENMEYNDGDGYVAYREVEGSLLDKAYNMLCWVIKKGYLMEVKR